MNELHSLLLPLMFGIFGLVVSGIMLALSVWRAGLGWRRGPLFVGGVMTLVGMVAAFVPFFWLDHLSPEDEYPAGLVSSAIRMPDGLRVVPTTVGNRLQVYDADWKFLRGWPIETGTSSMVVLRPLVQDEFEVFAIKGDRRYVFNTQGELIETGRYDKAAFPQNTGEPMMVPTPWYLMIFTNHLYPFLFCAGGFTLFALVCLYRNLAEKTKKTNGTQLVDSLGVA
ncbi:MAG TPA: hypothetical protein VMM56_07365 [Planctomycetaceae bacterium]|nr:hypothetical protein [Planctomycetaceae bacterium]